MIQPLKCLDCPILYSDFPLDVVLSKEQWLMINPEDCGVLCANCIIKRASKLPNITSVHLTFRQYKS